MDHDTPPRARSAASPAREVELKLETDRTALQRLKKAAPPPGFTVARAVTKPLQSIYFDTPDLALKTARWSLRVRKTGGSWVQTVKAGTGVVGGLSTPREHEVPVAGSMPDLTRIDDADLRERLWRLLDGAVLDPVFETAMTRTKRVFSGPDGAVVECALDAGEIRAGERSQPLFEAELELKDGPVESLFALAEGLAGLGSARLSRFTKAERGYRLVAGENGPAEAFKAEKAGVTSRDTVEDAFRAILRSCLVQIAANRDATLDSDAPEGPHQLRVGLRRLRSALKVYGKALAPETRERLDIDAQDLATRVGALRDLDVLAAEIVAPALAAAPDELAEPARERLSRALAARRLSTRRDLRAHLEGPAVNALVFHLGQIAEGDAWREAARAAHGVEIDAVWDAPLAGFAAKAMAKRWKAVARLGARLDELNLEERHDMRKALKKLRYTLEFFRPVFDRKTLKPFLSRLKRLQDVFGYLNDVVMAHTLVRLVAEEAEGDTEPTLAAGYVLGWHDARAAHAWQDTRALWDDTRAADRFWTS
uniref:CYTH and CHAD domain-containing protein n=1 Tax=Stappia sp. TaxID=1870903 RepID=UPI003BA9715C